VIAVELRKLFRRPRTWAIIAGLNALPLVVAVLLVLMLVVLVILR
jgi:ABC-2 type transport system permease protein